MSDLIDRQAAIDLVIDMEFMNNTAKGILRDRLRKLPSAQPEQRWIPCSERLPKIGKEVLLSEPNDMFLAEYHGNGDPEGVWHIDGIHHYLQDIKGCAWMPLPEPWRGEGS